MSTDLQNRAPSTPASARPVRTRTWLAFGAAAAAVAVTATLAFPQAPARAAEVPEVLVSAGESLSVAQTAIAEADSSVDTDLLRVYSARLAEPEAMRADTVAQIADEAQTEARLVRTQTIVAERAEQVRAEAEAAARAKAEEEARQKAEAQQRAIEEAAAKAAAELAAANTVEGAKATARSLAAENYGWGDGEFSCLASLWSKESSWDYTAENPSSGAYGIPQSLPGSKMATAGEDWRTNAGTQIVWGLEYIAAAYGTPCAAWGHSQATNWY